MSKLLWLVSIVLFFLKVVGLAGASWGLPALSWWFVVLPAIIGTVLFLFAVLLAIIVAAAEEQ